MTDLAGTALRDSFRDQVKMVRLVENVVMASLIISPSASGLTRCWWMPGRTSAQALVDTGRLALDESAPSSSGRVRDACMSCTCPVRTLLGNREDFCGAGC